jgi:tetratricopeptide (TPR) repeat protein
MAELAQRGMDSLLERAFEVNKVPAEQRQSTRALIAMRELRDPKSKLTQSQRDELVSRVTTGMEKALDQQKDPKLLMANAEELIRAAVLRELNTLEYWGETTQTMARLRPVATTVSHMLGKAAELARKQADDLANKLTSANDPRLEQYNQLDQLATRAEYTRRMNDYAVLMSMDPAAGNRAELAKGTLEYLKQYDTADSTVQPVVRVQMGKVMLASGDYEGATKTLDSVWQAGSDEKGEIQPVPSVGQRFEARYFAAVAQMKAGKTEEAQKRLDEMKPFVQSELSSSEAKSGAEAALMMLQYRVYAAAKQDEKARGALVELVKARPEFEGTVLEQLSSRLPENPDLKSLDVLMLRALFRRGETEQRKPEGVAVDEKAMDQAVAAGKELISRRGQAGVDSGLVEDTAIKLPLILERENKPLEAAGALLDFIDQFGGMHKNAAAALDEATYLVAKLRKERPEDQDVAKVYERLLATAVNPPFSKTELAYEWARRLQQTGRPAEAIRFFELVPANDSRAGLARFFRMVALKQVLDDGGLSSNEKFSAEERKKRTDELVKLAERVAGEARQRMSGGAESKNDKVILVRTSLVGADVALREQKDPERALKMLDGFEQAAAGLSNEKELTSQAMNVRVLALMDLHRNQEATQTLVKLLEKTGGAEGADIVFKLLTRLNEDFDRARLENDEGASRSLSKARAELSGFLVSWAEKNPDAKIRELTPKYRLFDAETKRVAAGLETDAGAREQDLQQALALYEGLRNPAKPDPSVELGIALCAYDLGQYEKARDMFATLLNERRLGRPVIEEDRNGETVTVPNDRYWDATLKLMRSTLKLVEAAKADASAKQGIVDGLKANYARWGKSLGGPKWGPEFEKLRQEIAPDYVVPDLSGPAAGPGAPATTRPTA